MADLAITRRGIVCAMMIAPAVIASPAIAAPTAFQCAVAKNQRAEALFNALPAVLELRDPAAHAAQEDALLLAWEDVVQAAPVDWREFESKFAILAEEDGEAMTAENAIALLADCRRLLELSLDRNL